jgi:hypothetical protein
MRLMFKAVDGVKQMLTMKPHECTVCAETKLKKTKMSREPITPAETPLERIHIDLVGPFPQSIRGNVYTCTVTDSNTRCKFVIY